MEKLESLVVRLEKAVSQLESGRGGGAGSPPGGAGDTADAVDSVSYKDYNDWIQAYVTPFVELSNKLGMFKGSSEWAADKQLIRAILSAK